MGKKSKRAPRSAVADAARLMQAVDRADASRQAARMAPAHAFLQGASRARLVSRAEKIATALRHDSAGEDTRALLHCIVNKRDVAIHEEHAADAVVVTTLGMSLLGLPELMAVWPKHLLEAARGVIQDKVRAALQGEREGTGSLEAGRAVFAARFEVGYEIVYGASPPEESITARLRALAVGAGHARADNPTAAVFQFVADVREGVLLPGPNHAAEAVKHRKNGEEIFFDGYVRLPVPSLSWQLTGMEFSMARLEDKEGDVIGPCRIVPPDVYMAEMGQYEIVA